MSRSLTLFTTSLFSLYPFIATSESEKSRLLHIVAVGGGPTGVETIAELSDFIKEDMAKYFPDVSENYDKSIILYLYISINIIL